jgi:hypothetical protein
MNKKLELESGSCDGSQSGRSKQWVLARILICGAKQDSCGLCGFYRNCIEFCWHCVELTDLLVVKYGLQI